MICTVHGFSFNKLKDFYLLLNPRKFNFKNKFKRRSFFKLPKNNKLTYSNYGLQILQPLRLNNKHIFRFKLFFKKASRRTDKTSRFVWFNLFPHLPLSKKVAGSRMGKGTGKLAAWVVELPSGVNIFEFKNLRYGRMSYFVKQVQFKLPIKSRIIKNTQIKPTLLPLSSSKKIILNYFW